MKDEGKYIKSAAVMIWFGNKLMMCKRLPTCKRFINRWGVPGGKVDGKECVITAAQRELFEETGLNVERFLFKLIDSHREGVFKCFVFKIELPIEYFKEVKNTEPHKHTDWQLFTKKEALALPTLMPALRKILGP